MTRNQFNDLKPGDFLVVKNFTRRGGSLPKHWTEVMAQFQGMLVEVLEISRKDNEIRIKEAPFLWVPGDFFVPANSKRNRKDPNIMFKQVKRERGREKTTSKTVEGSWGPIAKFLLNENDPV